MSDRNGGAAFPSPGVVMPDGRGEEMQQGAYEGMTLRDYFAAKAMQGLCVEGGKGSIADVLDHMELVAAISFRMADAMILERAK